MKQLLFTILLFLFCTIYIYTETAFETWQQDDKVTLVAFIIVVCLFAVSAFVTFIINIFIDKYKIKKFGWLG